MMATVRAWIFNLDRHWPKRIRVRHHWIYLCLRRLHAAPCPSLGLSVHFPCAYYDSSCSRMLTSHRGVPTRPSYANRCPKSIVLQPIAAPTTSRTGKQPFPPPPPEAIGIEMPRASGSQVHPELYVQTPNPTRTLFSDGSTPSQRISPSPWPLDRTYGHFSPWTPLGGVIHLLDYNSSTPVLRSKSPHDKCRGFSDFFFSARVIPNMGRTILVRKRIDSTTGMASPGPLGAPRPRGRGCILSEDLPPKRPSTKRQPPTCCEIMFLTAS